MRILGVVLLHLVVAACISWSDGLLCYSCQDLYSNEKCFNVTHCPTEEKCYGRADGLLSSEVKHTTGCTKEQNPLKTNVIGAYSFCSKPCETDLCNLNECTRDSQQNRTRGPRCLMCDLVQSPDECRHIVECSLDEMCFVSKIETFQQMRYRLGCIGKQHCSRSVSSASLVGRRSSNECNFCCTTDHCNLHACEGNGDVFTLNSMSPGINCTDSDPPLCLSIGRLNSDACIDSNIVRTCPKSCVTCDHVGWSTWQPWGSCSKTGNCYTGTRSRTRTCHNRLEITKYQSCVGDSMETSNCCNTAPADRFSFNNCHTNGVKSVTGLMMTALSLLVFGFIYNIITILFRSNCTAHWDKKVQLVVMAVMPFIAAVLMAVGVGVFYKEVLDEYELSEDKKHVGASFWLAVMSSVGSFLTGGFILFLGVCK